MRVRLLPGLLPLLLTPSLSNAIPEENFARDFETQVKPYYRTARQQGFFSGVDGVPISFVTFEQQEEKGALVVVNGRTSSHQHSYFQELFYDLRDKGYSVYSYDHRGQGLSGRMLDNPHKGYVKDFDDYVTDLKTFMDTVVKQRPHKKIIILAHSMGGAVATIYAIRFPEEVDGLILNAPMHKPAYGIYTEGQATAIAVTGVSLGQGDEYAIGQGDPKPLPETFNDNGGSQSQARFDALQGTLAEHEDIRVGGATYQWANETLKATRKMRNESGGLWTPTLILQAGKDKVVLPEGQNIVCQRAPACTRIIYPNAAHNMWQEKDETRNQVNADILEFADGIPDRSVRTVGCDQASGMTSMSGWMLVAWLLIGKKRR